MDPINTSSTPSEIASWKKSSKTAKCYERLFESIKKNEEFSFMSRILEKIWPRSECSEEHVAFAIAICECFLNPEIPSIQSSEYVTKESLLKNKVSNSIITKLFEYLLYFINNLIYSGGLRRVKDFFQKFLKMSKSLRKNQDPNQKRKRMITNQTTCK